MGVQAPPAFAAITTTAPRNLSTKPWNVKKVIQNKLTKNFWKIEDWRHFSNVENWQPEESSINKLTPQIPWSQSTKNLD